MARVRGRRFGTSCFLSCARLTSSSLSLPSSSRCARSTSSTSRTAARTVSSCCRCWSPATSWGNKAGSASDRPWVSCCSSSRWYRSSPSSSSSCVRRSADDSHRVRRPVDAHNCRRSSPQGRAQARRLARVPDHPDRAVDHAAALGDVHIAAAVWGDGEIRLPFAAAPSDFLELYDRLEGSRCRPLLLEFGHHHLSCGGAYPRLCLLCRLCVVAL